jgi:hypothetical protein
VERDSRTDSPGSTTPGSGQSEGNMGERAQEMGRQGQEKASEMAERAQERAEVGREQAAGGMHSAADQIRERTGSSEGMPREAGAKVAETMDSTANYLQEHSTSEIWNDVELYVRKHPGQALAGAVVAGLLIGRILR